MTRTSTQTLHHLHQSHDYADVSLVFLRTNQSSKLQFFIKASAIDMLQLIGGVRCCLLHSGYLHTFNLKHYLGVILFTWPVVFVLFDTSNMPVCIQGIIGYTMQVFAVITLVL